MSEAGETKQPEVKVKRYSLSKEEKMHVDNLQSVMGILSLLRKGIDHSVTLALMGARQRMAIKDTDAPEGYLRSVDFDPNSSELIVTDAPMAPEPAKKEVKGDGVIEVKEPVLGEKEDKIIAPVPEAVDTKVE